MQPDPIRVYIGFDKEEDAAYRVCERSMRLYSSRPLCITRLDQDWLRRASLFRRTHYRIDGQRYDSIDDRPFSTEFSFTRFLVPLLQPDGWALFCDSDMLWRADVAELWNMRDDRYAAMVVKHSFEPDAGVKMRGQVQEPYNRKAWSSLVLWNCNHPVNRAHLTAYQVNTQPGRWLHGFRWLRDEEIGALPLSWNWLDGYTSRDIHPKVVHFTRGTPDMQGWESTLYAKEWMSVYDEAMA